MNATAEQTIKKAAELIAGGGNAEQVVRFVYSLAYMEGALEMARKDIARRQIEIDRIAA